MAAKKKHPHHAKSAGPQKKQNFYRLLTTQKKPVQVHRPIPY